jgi:hypothetical protein
MLWIVAIGLFISGVTIWPAVSQLEFIVRTIWGDAPATGEIHAFTLKVIDGLKHLEDDYAFLLYGYDWLAFAHIALAILFAGAARDPVRNKWVIQCGLIMCCLIPILAGICIPLRGIPFWWFFIDFAFAPAAALPLTIALRDVCKAELNQSSKLQ